MRFQICFLVLCVVAGTWAGSLPSFLQACSASDPHLNQCIEGVIRAGGRKFAAGIPELGIASLDPVQLGTVEVDNPALKLTFTDTVVTGLSGFRLNSYRINPKKGQAAIDFTANVTLKAHYVMDGQVLILPIRGEGPSKIKITELNIVVKYNYVTKNGHWVVESHKDSYKMQKANFKFHNLFGGNKQLADTTSQFLNNSWEIVMTEVAPPALKSIIQRCVDEVEKFFAIVPADQLLKP